MVTRGGGILGELKPLLTGQHEGFREGRNRIDKLLREMQVRKCVRNVRTSAGVMLTEPTAIAREVARHWDGISTAPGNSVSKCTAYLQCIGAFQVLRKYGKALYRPLSKAIVEEGLKRFGLKELWGLTWARRFFQCPL